MNENGNRGDYLRDRSSCFYNFRDRHSRLDGIQRRKKLYSTNVITSQLGKKERHKIIKNIQRYITPDDLVAIMFSFFEKRNIPLDVRKIHTAMHEIKQKYPEILKEFSFSENDVYHFSRLLEKVFFRLQNSNLVSTINPDFKECIIHDKSKQYVKKNILPLLDKDNQEKLAQIGKLFEQLVTS